MTNTTRPREAQDRTAAELRDEGTGSIPAEEGQVVDDNPKVRQESRIGTETQSLTSIHTLGKQLAEIQLTQLEDEHDLDFEDQATARPHDRRTTR